MTPTQEPEKTPKTENAVTSPKSASPKKKRVKKEKVIKPPPPPPKTTARGELVRKALEVKATEEKVAHDKRLDALKESAAKRKAVTAEKKAKEIAENGDPADKKAPSKKKKKTIPNWASLSDADIQRLKAKNAASAVEKPKSSAIIAEAALKVADSKNVSTVIAMKSYVKKTYPLLPKSAFKKGLLKAIDKGALKRVKGVGLSGSFKLVKQDAPKAKSKKAAAPPVDKCPFDDLIPHIFTWVCEPKEASAGMIKKYLDKHLPHLSTDTKPFKKALENGVAKGQLERITGKGASGTFGLIDGAKKTGTRYEDAFEDAIIAMNEPKDASIPALRHYLKEFNTEYGIAERPQILKSCLERMEAKGHIQRISGKGFSGTFRLAYPYFPSPKELWREAYDESNYSSDAPKSRKRSEASDSEESEEEEDEEVVPVKKSRAAPVPRKTALVTKKKTAQKPAPKKANKPAPKPSNGLAKHWVPAAKKSSLKRAQNKKKVSPRKRR